MILKSSSQTCLPAGSSAFIQHPGSPGCPQQLLIRVNLMKLFRIKRRIFFAPGIGSFRFSITALALGSLESHILPSLKINATEY